MKCCRQTIKIFRIRTQQTIKQTRFRDKLIGLLPGTESFVCGWSPFQKVIDYVSLDTVVEFSTRKAVMCDEKGENYNFEDNA